MKKTKSVLLWLLFMISIMTLLLWFVVQQTLFTLPSIWLWMITIFLFATSIVKNCKNKKNNELKLCKKVERYVQEKKQIKLLNNTHKKKEKFSEKSLIKKKLS